MEVLGAFEHHRVEFASVSNYGTLLKLAGGEFISKLSELDDMRGRIQMTMPSSPRTAGSPASGALLRLLGSAATGRMALGIMMIKKPLSITSVTELGALVGQKLQIVAPSAEGMRMNLRAVAASKHHKMTADDFRVNDATIGLIYALENQAAMLEDGNHLTRAWNKAQEAAEAKARIEPVTGPANRYGVAAWFEDWLACQDQVRTGAVLDIDLDRFKSIYDTLGHAAGDEVLKAVAERIADSAPAETGNFAAPIGGDELVVILREAADTIRITPALRHRTL